MPNSTNLRLLASGNNERGDLFTRLVKDLFFALGYDNLRLDVHRSGREVDIQGEHRLEPRQVVAECKAHEKKMGGDELNKFFGVLARERKRHSPRPVAGYFVSLNGFTETGIEQELETGDDRLILLNANDVVEELERSRVIVSRAYASEQAGRCAEHAKLKDAVVDSSELLGHERGYVWAIFYTRGKDLRAFALIHADGTPLADSVAQELIEADKLLGGSLHTLEYLAPPEPRSARLALIRQVNETYRKWLGEDCGYIQLDGLPADTDLSATRLKLERLFVPVKANYLPKADDTEEVKEEKLKTVVPIGAVLERISHVAVLAAPGGGKSTLVKRLATAYAFPERRTQSADRLPEREWLPLILRCRELRDRAHRPIAELLDDIPLHVGMNGDETKVFRGLAHTALRAGSALLLIDGLDEISDEGARQTFANHLRTLIAMFPQAALVVTSREAGFRLVGGVVASACEPIKLAPLDQSDVLSLCERWHVEVIGDNERVRAEAKELGRTIWRNERIRKLVENPLLLTTLLVVKRWVGELPRSRAALYREAIRVLVRTWNVEGYAPLDEDETLAQLSYVACAMMAEGKQQIGQRALLKLLQEARQELEAELQFARISPKEFVDRIEYRSSLLMQIGHQRTEDLVEPLYEFRHLTFQEYLAARGYVEEQYPGRDKGTTLVALLKPRFNDEQWQEVIPLAAVLAGRKAEELIKGLIATCKQRHIYESTRGRVGEHFPIQLLYQCIRDEVQITGPTLRQALLELGREVRYAIRTQEDWIVGIFKGKFGRIFQEIVEEVYLSGNDGFEGYLRAFEELARIIWFQDEELTLTETNGAKIETALRSGNRLERAQAAIVCMLLAYNEGSEFEEGPEKDRFTAHFQSFYELLLPMLGSKDWPCALLASWAMAWIGEHRMLRRTRPELLESLFHLWYSSGFVPRARFPAWALQSQELLPRDTFDAGVWGDCDSFLREASELKSGELHEMPLAALVVGWYRRRPWTDAEIAMQIDKASEYFPISDRTARGLLKRLGQPGQEVLVKWKRKEEELAKDEIAASLS